MQLGLCVLLTPNVSEDTMELRGLLLTPGPVITFWSHQNTERQGKRTRSRKRSACRTFRNNRGCRVGVVGSEDNLINGGPNCHASLMMRGLRGIVLIELTRLPLRCEDGLGATFAASLRPAY